MLPGGANDVEQFANVVDYHMQLETEEPPSNRFRVPPVLEIYDGAKFAGCGRPLSATSWQSKVPLDLDHFKQWRHRHSTAGEQLTHL
jgi:hypothetical protein